MALRFTILLSTVSGLLVAASLLIGQMTGASIMTATLEMDDRTYLLYIEDIDRRFRVVLAGTRCFESPPPRSVQIGWDSSPPITSYSRLLLEFVHDINDVLPLCHPARTAPESLPQ